MKVLVLYRPDSEHGRLVEEFIHNYQLKYGSASFEVQNVDGRDGDAAARLYDVVQYPAILALREDGQLLRSWEGDTMPLLDEVAAYAHA